MGYLTYITKNICIHASSSLGTVGNIIHFKRPESEVISMFLILF